MNFNPARVADESKIVDTITIEVGREELHKDIVRSIFCGCVTRTHIRTHVHVFVSAHACMRVLRSRSRAGGHAGGKALRRRSGPAGRRVMCGCVREYVHAHTHVHADLCVCVCVCALRALRVLSECAHVRARACVGIVGACLRSCESGARDSVHVFENAGVGPGWVSMGGRASRRPGGRPCAQAGEVLTCAGARALWSVPWGLFA